LQLTAQRQISDGGGLVGAVVSTSTGVSLRQQLPGRWDALWSGSFAKNTSVSSGNLTSDYQSESAGFALQRPITERASLRFAYDFLHQRGAGQTPLAGNLDRNLVTVQFTYKFRQIELGR
jgi:hypothetical protein